MESMDPPRIGIIAFGSLIDDPGEEIRGAEVERLTGVTTPFPVEFARTSSTRDGAPTLVPVQEGGAPVVAQVIVLREGLTLEVARDILYRRETERVGRPDVRYRPDPEKRNQVYIEDSPDLAGLDYVLHTRISANIDPLTSATLVDLAIASARGPSGETGRDGITYLQRALINGIRTPLSEAYREGILKATGASDLIGALAAVRAVE